MPLFSPISLTSDVKRRSFFATGAAAWIALFLVLLLGAAMIFRTPQKPVDVLKEINGFVNAEFFAHNFLLVWLAGGPNEAEKLVSMSAMTGQPEMNKDPVTVMDINTVPPVLRTPAGNETEWALTLAATLVPPGGSGTSIRTHFRVTFLDAQGTFKALMWPRPVNATSRPVQIAPFYEQGIGLNTPLGTAVSNFMSAFYTSHDEGSLGRFVSSEFTEDPIAGSPYTSITVLSIKAGEGSPDAASAKPGDTINLLATAKAASSTTTFNMIDAPLRVTLSSNRQWLVDGFDEPIHFGAVHYQ
ncbi:conjugal transfer protein [Mycolicibacterium goodii]|uniref:conjugal transfer protein n=1 Tax=Mycolicibacterium goodii TaxID=134601 RepID=UPI001BDC363E|nr:conjugal transfer protein [Mycolicibacterium goodii]MBU8841693.1 conjugal transfer protein [Mycolicibacterium goodii]